MLLLKGRSGGPQTRIFGPEGCGLRLRPRERIRRSLLPQLLQLLRGLGRGAPRLGSGCLGRYHGGRLHIQCGVVVPTSSPSEAVVIILDGLRPSGLPLARPEVTGDLACNREVKRYIQSMQDLPFT